MRFDGSTFGGFASTGGALRKPMRRCDRVLLVDGFTRATWRTVRKDPATKRETSTATLVIDLFEPLSTKDVVAVTTEGYSLLTFADVRIKTPA